KVQQQLRHFSLPRRRLVRTVGGGEVTLLVAEAVGPLRAAVRPQIGTPAQPRSPDGALGWIVGQRGVALELLLDEPLHRKAGLIGVGLWIELCLGVAAVGARREVNELDVG